MAVKKEKKSEVKTSNNIKINTVASLMLQIATVVSGLLLPRLILSTFGSDINGLVSSITQFLSFFSVLEGGISGVVLAALYGPVVKRDNRKISEIVCAANKFLRKLAIGFLIYTVILAILYPFSNDLFSWPFTASLVLIISITIFIQYYYTIVPQLIVRADNKVYVYNLVAFAFVILNIVITVLCIHFFPEIHAVKLLSVLFFILQPVVLNLYVNKHFEIDKNCQADEGILKNRWSGFGINIANIITTNTDVIVLTLFSTLKTVSIYTIYYNIVNSLKNLLMSFGYGYQSLLGQKIAQNDNKGMNHYFNQYEFVSFNFSGIVYSCCICLIVPFIMIYTNGVKDANYRQILFAILICLAIYILCIREPYIQATYTAGLFKETQKYAYIEAALNIIISVACVKGFGLIGVAIGTVISAFYRYLATVIFLQKHVLNRPATASIQKLIIYMIPMILVCVIGSRLLSADLNIIKWIIYAIVILIVSAVLHLLTDVIFFRDELKSIGLFNKILRR